MRKETGVGEGISREEDHGFDERPDSIEEYEGF